VTVGLARAGRLDVTPSRARFTQVDRPLWASPVVPLRPPLFDCHSSTAIIERLKPTILQSVITSNIFLELIATLSETSRPLAPLNV